MAMETVERGSPPHVIPGQIGYASTATDTYLAKLMPSERIAVMRRAGWSLKPE